MWCLGDLVGYGADPDACVDLAREHAAICLAGNHDLGVRGTIPLERVLPRRGAGRHLDPQHIGPETREYLESWSPQNVEEVVALYHASPRDPVWEDVLSPLQAELCLDVQARRISLIGHSHVALSFSRVPGSPATGQTRADGEELDLKRASGWSTPAASASPVTAIRGRPGWSWTSTAGGRPTVAPSTTSMARRRRSARLGSRIRWRSGCSTASRRLSARMQAKVRRRMGFGSRAFLAGGLGFAAAFAVACGSTNGLLSADQNSSLTSQLDSVSQAVEAHNCDRPTAPPPR